MGRQNKFHEVVCGMVSVLDCPLTVKMRTGVYDKSWNAHRLAPKLRDCGVSMVTVCCCFFCCFFCLFFFGMEDRVLQSVVSFIFRMCKVPWGNIPTCVCVCVCVCVCMCVCVCVCMCVVCVCVCVSSCHIHV